MVVVILLGIYNQTGAVVVDKKLFSVIVLGFYFIRIRNHVWWTFDERDVRIVSSVLLDRKLIQMYQKSRATDFLNGFKKFNVLEILNLEFSPDG